MDDSNIKQPAINTVRVNAIEDAQATKSGPDRPRSAAILAVRGKRGRFAGLIVLMSSAGIAGLFYLLRSLPDKRFEGLAAAICAITGGGVLVCYLIHLMEVEDKLQGRQLDANQATVSLEEPAGAGQRPTSDNPLPETAKSPE